MADINNKPKIQIRSGLSFNGNDKSPSPGSKLLINHGKPNFTIQRSPKVQQNGNTNPLSPQIQNNNNNKSWTNGNVEKNNNNNNAIVVNSTKFNGVFRPANITIPAKQPHQQNISTENEAAKVVLRRAKLPDPPLKEGEDDSVPEFIRRQRRIQERLAKENILDFESRRSGYFTQVMISPSSPNRTSFVETMSSPAIVPALEMPLATRAIVVEETPEEVEDDSQGGEVNGVEEQETKDDTKHTTGVEENHKVEESKNHEVQENHKVQEKQEVEEKQQVEEEKEPVEKGATTVIPVCNGSSDGGHVEEEEVARAIEEVNKAVAGEDDTNDLAEEPLVTITNTETTEQHKSSEEESKVEIVHTTAAIESGETKEAESAKPAEQNGHADIQTNGHSEVTISHTKALESPSIPAPDPSGELGVNYEPKTIVSFAKELGSEPNKYPDTVKIVKEGEEKPTTPVDAELQEMAKLKFDIKADEKDVEVTPVLRVD